MAEDDAENVRAPAFAVGQPQRHAGAEIDLSLFPGSALQAPEGQILSRGQVTAEAPDAVILASEAVFGDQVLVDALRGQALIELGLDERAEWLAQTGLPQRTWRRGLKRFRAYLRRFGRDAAGCLQRLRGIGRAGGRLA